MIVRVEYLKILIFFLVAFFFVSLLIGISFFLNKRLFKTSRHRPVECGSHSFGSGKNKIEINFYIITILFVIFEVEFIVLIPWLFFLNVSYFYSIMVMLCFLIILVLGLVFEYCRGVFLLDFKNYKSDNKSNDEIKLDEVFKNSIDKLLK